MPPASKSARSIPTRALALGVALCALLAVVALATRTDHPSAGKSSDTRELPTQFLDYVFTFSLVAGILMVAVLAYYRARFQQQTGRGGWELRQMVMFVCAIAAICMIAVFWAERLREGNGLRLRSGGVNTVTAVQTDANGKPLPQRTPSLRWEAVLVAGSIGVAVAAGFWLTKRAKRRPDERTLREDLTAILQDTIDKLWDEQDPRRAVILAYAWMERTLAAHGLPRAPSEAPLEYLARVLIELDASRESVFELTTLFERARFSPHVIDDEMKGEAIAALSAVRDELSAAEAVAA